MKRLGDLYRLLVPHAAPHIGGLFLIIVFGTLSALLQQGAYVLLMPTWKAMFPEAKVEASAEESTASDDKEPGLLDRGKEWLEDTIIGDPATLSTNTEQRERALWKVGATVGVMATLAAIFHYLTGILSGLISLRMVVSLRMQLARHLMGLSMRYHTGRKFGDLLSRISSDVGQTTQVVKLILRDLVQEPLMFLVSIGIAFWISPLVTSFVLFGLPLFVIPVSILIKKVRKRSHKSASQLGSTFHVLTQMFQGVRTVKAYRAEERELERFASTNESYVKATMRMVRASVLSRAWTIFFTNVGIAVVVIIVGLVVVPTQAIDDSSEMVVLFLMISQASSHLKRTTRIIAQVSEAQGPAQRLLEVMAERPDVTEASNPIELESLGTGIRFEGVDFEYPENETDEQQPLEATRFSIKGLDLDIRPGETLAVVGPSGSGKSTLLDLVARFVDPTAGKVTVDGHDLREVSFDSWTTRYALVTQSPFLFHASVAENIRYGKPDATREEVIAAARAANIHEFIEGLTDGYDTDVQDAGTRLSGGQRQRITIARALLRNPDLLLLDEATSALDTASEAIVQEALEKMMVGRTTIVIAHRLSTVRRADRIAVMERGRIVEIGDHDTLVGERGLYAELSAAQAL